MSKFERELERFVVDYHADHDMEKERIDKWANGVEKDLQKLDKQCSGFERDFESVLGKIDRWFEKKQNDLEDAFEKD